MSAKDKYKLNLPRVDRIINKAYNGYLTRRAATQLKSHHNWQVQIPMENLINAKKVADANSVEVEDEEQQPEDYQGEVEKLWGPTYEEIRQANEEDKRQEEEVEKLNEEEVEDEEQQPEDYQGEVEKFNEKRKEEEDDRWSPTSEEIRQANERKEEDKRQEAEREKLEKENEEYLSDEWDLENPRPDYG